MKVVSYQAHNVLRIADIDFSLEGHHLFLIGGKNDQGKSSALLALLMALCGKQGMDYPPVALKKGQMEGWVRVKLQEEETEWNIELYLKRTRSGSTTERFRVVDQDGQKYDSPRTLLKRLFHAKGIDPLAYLNLDKKAKRETFLQMIGVDMEEYEEEYKKAFDERAKVARDGKAVSAQFKALPHHDGIPAEVVEVDKLMGKAEEARQHNARNQKEKERLERFRGELETLIGQYTDAKTALEEAESNLASAENAMEIKNSEMKALEKTCELLEDMDVDEINAQIATASEINGKIQENRHRAQLGEQLKGLQNKWVELDSGLTKMKEELDESIQQAEIPVDGMTVDEDGVLLDGLPIEQACKSRQIVASTLMAMALNPRLKLFVCQDGSDLDTDTILALDKVLEEKGYQMIVELVTRTEADEAMCAVVIENGKEKGGDDGDVEKESTEGAGPAPEKTERSSGLPEW